MNPTHTFWPPSAPTLEHSLLLSLADSLSPPADPVAADPAQLMVQAGLHPDPWQAELLRSDWQRALLLCSRQSGKSTVTAILAVHTAVYTPGSLTLLLSPGLRQSQELFHTVMGLYHRIVAPVAVAQESALRVQLANGSRIIALPGTEATIRGYAGVNLLIIDEAARVLDPLYYSVRPMLAVSGGRLIALSTPFGQRGFFHQEWTEGGPDWHRVKVLATQCPRISAEFLAEERRAIGDWWYRQEYNCEFVDTIDQVFTYAEVMAALSGTVAPLFETIPTGEGDTLWQNGKQNGNMF